MNIALLALEDGTVFEGRSFGAHTERGGEVVFNTSLTGYQEIFTDPSYAGQIVVLTNPQIGNYGTNDYDCEALHPYIEGLAVREFSPAASSWRSEEEADQFLNAAGVPIISGIDTRALVRKLRSGGVMRGVLSSQTTDADALVAKANRFPP
ncbi:MAG: carbamoyl-phosphate synthase domain-containing protein [Bryobacteraceae bacterium]